METARVNLLILDVDGVLTDGRVVPAGVGPAFSRSRDRLEACPTQTGCFPVSFHTQDGCAIKLWQRCGGRVAILSGRTSAAVQDRAVELGIEQVHLGVSDKLAGYEAIVAAAVCPDAEVGYMGDDLPDLRPMARCALPVAVANAVPAVKRAAMYVTRRSGGFGAVAEVIELLLRRRKEWSEALLRVP